MSTPVDNTAEQLRLARRQFPQTGRVTAISLRPERGQPTVAVESAEAVVDHGLTGDHYQKVGGKRQVTLIQAEHLEVIASLMGHDTVDPLVVRRNVVVRGINLLALIRRRFRVGSVLLEGTGPCAPCEQMEEQLGAGGLNAMEGHGGIIARVIEPGRLSVGDEVNSAD